MIDCDVHNDWVSAEVLLPYLEPYYRDCLARGELPGTKGSFPHGHRAWFHPEGYKRADVTPDDGSAAGADYGLMRKLLLDRYHVDYAVLTGEEVEEVSTLGNIYYASALAKAYNDWLIDYWLRLDPRLKGSLIVAPHDPGGAAKEIRRIGAHPDIVQVLVTAGSQRPYGDPFYHPIWQAAADVGLPVAIHLGGQGGVNNGPASAGPPTFYWEAHALHCEPAMGHVGSLIAHGIFEKWPGLTFILIECGVAWLPGILWRLDNDYKALRKETPWLKRLPSEYARDHIRMSTQPIERPANKQHLWDVLEAIDGKNTLLFASDYPHWDFDDPTQLPIPPDWKENVFDLNARQVYKRLPAHAESSLEDATSTVAAKGPI
jgi:predicted TIM-barrel fold metal-dependent hydrolase